MLDIIYKYQSLLNNIDGYIDNNKFRIEYLIAQLRISPPSFYKKVKKKNFTVDEMITMRHISFLEEAKAFEIKEALKASREDSKHGRIRNHQNVMIDIRKKLQKVSK